MAVLGWTVLAVLALLLVVVLVLLATPLHMRVEAEFGERQRLHAEFRTLWGRSPRLRFDLGGAREGPRPSGPERPLLRPKPGKRKGKGGGGFSFSPDLFAAVREFVLGELRRIHVDVLRADITFGTGDPADTGTLFGLLAPLRYAWPSRVLSLSLTPDFDRRCLEGRAEAALHLTPLALAGPALRLGWRILRRGHGAEA